jgi:ketosteroid isomerase-like protein
MSEHENLEVIRNTYAAFGRGDLDGILALLDPQVSWRTPGPPDLPSAGLRRGIAEVREFFGVLLSTLEIQDFRPAEFLVQGDTVVVLGTSREAPKGSDRLLDFRWVHVFRLRNGKIVEFEEPADVSALVEEYRRMHPATQGHAATSS